MSVKDLTGSFEKFHASRNGGEMGFTVTYTITLHERDLAERFEAYRRKHNLSAGQFFSKAGEVLTKDEPAA